MSTTSSVPDANYPVTQNAAAPPAQQFQGVQAAPAFPEETAQPREQKPVQSDRATSGWKGFVNDFLDGLSG
jgi:hypothetical protein